MATMLIKNIDDETYRKFKAACAAKGETIQQVIKRLMEKESQKK